MIRDTWEPKGIQVSKTIDELRPVLKALALKRKGKQLIAPKFVKDHVFPGHSGAVNVLSKQLATLRNHGDLKQPRTPLSTYMTSSLDQSAQAEVLNWIRAVPKNVLTFNKGVWTVAKVNSTVEAVYSYSFATADVAAWKATTPNDRVTKSRKWLTPSTKRPKVACQFDEDGTPVIYHLDF